MTDYDYFKASIKSSWAEELEKMYSSMNWEIAEREEDSRYSDIINYTFLRPHNISNKDELQYLQVAAETQFNELDRISRIKHARSTPLGLAIGLLGLAAFGGGIAVLNLFDTALSIAGGCMLIILGIILFTMAAVASYVVVQRENGLFEKKSVELRDKITEICVLAYSLGGGGEKNQNVEN